MVSGDSADVWARQEDFRLDASVGAPPDAFSETGQDWGFPAYRWHTIAAGGYQWLAARAPAQRRDLRRVTASITSSASSAPTCASADGSAGLRAARRGRIRSARAKRVLERAERAGRAAHRRRPRRDPGVRARDARAARDPRLQGAALGARVGRRRDGRSRIPRHYPGTSVATSGTHDTETNAEWWDEAPVDERARAGRVDHDGPPPIPTRRSTTPTRDAILDSCSIASGSDIVTRCRSTTCSAGASASTRRRSSSDENWTVAAAVARRGSPDQPDRDRARRLRARPDRAHAALSATCCGGRRSGPEDGFPEGFSHFGSS